MPTVRAPRSVLLVFAAVVATGFLGALRAQTPLARERVLYVSAVDDKGEPVAGLDPDAFVVREEGVRREVLRVSRATEPIDLALLVDNSAAIRDMVTLIRQGVSTFITRMAPRNQIALIALADRPTILVDYTSDTKRLADGVGRVFPTTQSGMTLLDAVTETSRGLSRREGPRAVIVAVLTDGVEFSNRYSKDVTKELVRAGAAFHLVGIGQFLHSDEADGIRERSFFLDEGTRTSGGQRIMLLSPIGIEPALERLARELSSQYKVVYARPQSLIAPEKIEIASARAGITMRGAPERGQDGGGR
jgi:VWFA-related protein